MDPSWLPFYLPGVDKKVATRSASFCQHGLIIAVSPQNYIPCYHPAMFYIMAELVEQR